MHFIFTGSRLPTGMFQNIKILKYSVFKYMCDINYPVSNMHELNQDYVNDPKNSTRELIKYISTKVLKKWHS